MNVTPPVGSWVWAPSLTVTRDADVTGRPRSNSPSLDLVLSSGVPVSPYLLA